MIRPPPRSPLFPYTTLFRSTRSRCFRKSSSAAIPYTLPQRGAIQKVAEESQVAGLRPKRLQVMVANLPLRGGQVIFSRPDQPRRRSRRIHGKARHVRPGIAEHFVFTLHPIQIG